MIHTIHNSCLTVSVSEQGAQLHSILGADGIEYLWQGDPKYWSDRALNLFPYVARLTEGSYCLDGKRHQMAIHGLAPYRRFSCTSIDGTSMTFTLTSDEETHAAYPRDFAFHIRYALRGTLLEVTFEVENRDEKEMYFGLGGHPGFNVPLTKGLKFEDYQLRFRDPCRPVRIGFTGDCYLNGQDIPYPLVDDRFLPLRHDLFDDDAIVLKDICREVTLESKTDGHSVTVSFPDMPYLGLWHWPRTDAPYLCIEPWCSLPSTSDKIAVFEEQPDLIRLAPGAIYRNLWTIRIN